MRNRRGIPINSFVDESVIYVPSNGSRAPLDLISMKVLVCIKAQVDECWRASIAILHPRSLATGVVVHVYEDLARVFAEELDIDFLSGRITMQEHACDQPGDVCPSHLGYKAAIQITLPATKRCRRKLPHGGALLTK